jgi:chaperonin GroES
LSDLAGLPNFDPNQAQVLGLGGRPPLNLVHPTAPAPSWDESWAGGNELLDTGDAKLADMPFDGNLAEALPEDLLSEIATRIDRGIEADIESNRAHLERCKDALDLLGLEPKKRESIPFENASGATHPLMKHALLNFRAVARKELLPASGPVRTEIFGDATPDVEARAQRKQNWLNYYLTHEDEEYYPDYNQMLLLLGLNGSMFRHVWRDPLSRGLPLSRYLAPENLIVNYYATTLAGPYRVTRVQTNVPFADIRRLQVANWYRTVALQIPNEESELAENDPRKTTEKRTPPEEDIDRPYEICHCHCVLDIAGLEHTDQRGQMTGIPVPYIVTMDRKSRKVLRVARNWVQNDPDNRPIECYVHYRYMPGDGFLGWGLPHLVGNDTNALTTLLRMAINSNMLVSFPGGVRVKGVLKTESNRIKAGPGEFPEIETGGLPIQQALMPFPYKDVPASFPILMETLENAAQRTASISDMAVGEGREDALPGTVIAMIEKATKLESAVIADLHVAQRKELRLIAKLFGEDADAKYPFTINGQRGMTIEGDFADNADIVPVSDPNIPTQTQRLAKAQAEMQVANQSNGLVDVKAATENFLRVLGNNDSQIQQLMPPQQQAQPADPVTEFMAIMKHQPVMAGPHQDHAAHIQAHMAQMAAPGLPKTPMGAALQAHIGEHVGHFYAAQAGALTGMPIQPGQQLPTQIEAQIAAAVAAASNQLAIQLQQLAPASQTDPTAYAKIQADVLKTHQQEADSQRKDQQSARAAQMEALTKQAQLRDAAAQRQHDARMAILRLQETQTKAGADTTDALLSHVSDLGAARHETMQAAMQTATAHDTNRANMHVADKEAEAAKAAAQVAARRKTQ